MGTQLHNQPTSLLILTKQNWGEEQIHSSINTLSELTFVFIQLTSIRGKSLVHLPVVRALLSSEAKRNLAASPCALRVIPRHIPEVHTKLCHHQGLFLWCSATEQHDFAILHICPLLAPQGWWLLRAGSRARHEGSCSECGDTWTEVTGLR